MKTPFAIAALALAIAAFPAAGGAQVTLDPTQLLSELNTVKSTAQTSIKQALLQLGTELPSGGVPSPTKAVQLQVQKVQTIIVARTATPAPNDGLAAEIAKIAPLVSATQNDMNQRLAIVTKLKTALSALDGTLTTIGEAHLKVAPAQALLLEIQLDQLEGAIRSENAAILQDQQTLQQLEKTVATFQATQKALQASEAANLKLMAESLQKVTQTSTTTLEQQMLAAMLAANAAAQSKLKNITSSAP
jgi:hypothetical protein